MEHNEVVERTWTLSDLMCQAAQVRLFSTVLVADSNRDVFAIKKGWAGGEPEEKSCASFVGPLKAMELLLDLSRPFDMTPTGNLLGSGWMGGVRQRRDEEFHFVTSGSAWSQCCDAQHALLMNYAMFQEVRFHHVGHRHPTREAMLDAVGKDEERLEASAVAVPADDHERFYLPVETEAHPNGVYWVEHQFFPKGRKDPGLHWDVVTMRSEDLLRFVAKGLLVEPRIWQAGLNDPSGVVWQQNRGIPFGVMTRGHWWVPGE